MIFICFINIYHKVVVTKMKKKTFIRQGCIKFIRSYSKSIF